MGKYDDLFDGGVTTAPAGKYADLFDMEVVPTPQELSTLEAPEGSPQREEINRAVAGNLFAPPGRFAREPTLAELIRIGPQQETEIPLRPREAPLPEQGAFEQGGVLPYVAGAAQAVESMVPTSWEQAREMIKPPMGGVDIERENELGAAWRGEHGPVEQAAAITGTALQAAPLVGLPFAKTPLRASPADLALVERIKALPPETTVGDAIRVAREVPPETPIQAIPELLSRPPEGPVQAPVMENQFVTSPLMTSERSIEATLAEPVTTDYIENLPNRPYPELTPEAASKQQKAANRLIEERYRFASAEVQRAHGINPRTGLIEPPEGPPAPQEPLAPVTSEAAPPPPTAELALRQAIRSGGTNIPRYVELADGSVRQVAPFNPLVTEGEVGLADGNAADLNTVRRVLDENRNPIHSVTEPPEPYTPEAAAARAAEQPSGAGPAAAEAMAGEPPPTPPVAEPAVSVPQKPSKIGQSIEAKAVETKLTQGFPETAGYDPITIKDQAARASSLVEDSHAHARAIVRGEAPLPAEVRGTSLITAMEEHLLRHPDAQLAYELANSRLVSLTSEAAQEMRLMSERVPDAITTKFAEIKAAREAGAKLRGETPAKIKADISREVVRQASKRPTWEAFVREIVC